MRCSCGSAHQRLPGLPSQKSVAVEHPVEEETWKPQFNHTFPPEEQERSEQGSPASHSQGLLNRFRQPVFTPCLQELDAKILRILLRASNVQATLELSSREDSRDAKHTAGSGPFSSFPKEHPSLKAGILSSKHAWDKLLNQMLGMVTAQMTSVHGTSHGQQERMSVSL